MDLGVFINKIADDIGENRGVGLILDNPFYMAVMITLVVLLAINFARIDGVVRQGVYIMLFVSASLFLYHRRFMHKQISGASADAARYATYTPLVSDADMIAIQPVSLL